MKQYIFFYKLNRQYKECKVEARGMMEALEKARKLKKLIEAEALTGIQLKFKGVLFESY